MAFQNGDAEFRPVGGFFPVYHTGQAGIANKLLALKGGDHDASRVSGCAGNKGFLLLNGENHLLRIAQTVLRFCRALPQIGQHIHRIGGGGTAQCINFAVFAVKIFFFVQHGIYRPFLRVVLYITSL